MNRAFSNVLAAEVEQTARFYEELLGMHRVGEFGWFIVLGHEGMPGFEFGILDQDHASIPDGISKNAGGTVFTFVVPDLDPVVSKAEALGAEVIQKPTVLPYGQRRLMLRDPAGSSVDISSPIS